MTQSPSTFDITDDFFAHHGVKGMRWGVRKDGSTSSAASKASDDAKRAGELRTKAKKSGGTAALSNKEMQELVTRMNLQQQYSRLTKKPSKINVTQNQVKAVLAIGATVNTAIAFMNTPAGKALKVAMESGGGKHNALNPPAGPAGPRPPSSGPGRHRK